eukprot:366152-Chlamydomonas_euryale.AAC.5
MQLGLPLRSDTPPRHTSVTYEPRRFEKRPPHLHYRQTRPPQLHPPSTKFDCGRSVELRVARSAQRRPPRRLAAPRARSSVYREAVVWAVIFGLWKDLGIPVHRGAPASDPLLRFKRVLAPSPGRDLTCHAPRRVGLKAVLQANCIAWRGARRRFARQDGGGVGSSGAAPLRWRWLISILPCGRGPCKRGQCTNAACDQVPHTSSGMPPGKCSGSRGASFCRCCCVRRCWCCRLADCRTQQPCGTGGTRRRWHRSSSTNGWTWTWCADVSNTHASMHAVNRAS